MHTLRTIFLVVAIGHGLFAAVVCATNGVLGAVVFGPGALLLGAAALSRS